MIGKNIKFVVMKLLLLTALIKILRSSKTTEQRGSARCWRSRSETYNPSRGHPGPARAVQGSPRDLSVSDNVEVAWLQMMPTADRAKLDSEHQKRSHANSCLAILVTTSGG